MSLDGGRLLTDLEHFHALPSGYRLKEYEVVRVLGHGGFGITYLGFDDNLNKPVAIKEYLPDGLAVRDSTDSVVPKAASLAEDFQWGLERFLDEARTLARFRHLNLIQVLRFFRSSGTAYIVMEYAEGETLAALLIRKDRLTHDEIWSILEPLLSGLEELHARQFMHRDIKPANIIIRDDGLPVLIDFGAARQTVSSKSQSLTAIVTAKYAPLEQYSSDGHQGPWTDIYAMGAVAYRALTGELPPDSTMRMPDDPYVPARELAAGRAPETFLEAIDWALSVFAVNRPQTIAEWRKALKGSAVKPARAPASPIATPKEPEPSSMGEQDLLDLTARAEGGDREAQLDLGFMYERGQGVTQSDAKAVKWYRLAADQGYAIAQSNLGVMYELGQGVTQSVTEAAKWYRLAANQSSAAGQSNLGVMYELGQGVTKSDKKAVKWYRLAADQGYAAGQTNIGVMYEGGRGVRKSDAEAVKWYQLAADQGYARAQANLGFMYDCGQGVTKSDTSAVKWYRLAADQGHARAQSNLGVMYEFGQGVTKSDAEAVKCYLLAADQGDAAAQTNLGVMYEDGRGVPKSDAEAVKWYLLAADQGHARAQASLGFMYDCGQGVTKSDNNAVKWYRLAADQGHATAQSNLGVKYELGQGVTKSDAEAVKWYRLAVDQGDAAAQTNLGLMYEYGRGVPKRRVKAVKCYLLAADQGYARAQSNLGVMYESGQGVALDLVECLKWQRLAMAGGHVEAESDVKRLEGKLDAVQIAEAASRANDWLSANKKS